MEEDIKIILICEDVTSKVTLPPGMTDTDFKKLCSTTFNKKPEHLLSVLSHSGEVLNLVKLLQNPQFVLGNHRELTLIFADPDDDDPPRKKHKKNPGDKTQSDDDLTKEEKVIRLFQKLAKDPEVQIVEQTYAAANIPGANTSGHVFLNNLIMTDRSACLNEAKNHKWINILQSDDTYLKSDCDEQLLLCFCFRRSVRLHSLKIRAPQNGMAPKTLKLYSNQAYMDFNSVMDLAPQEVIHLTPKHFDPNQIIPLNSIKFPRVNSISLFIEDNQGKQTNTLIDEIQFIGKPL